LHAEGHRFDPDWLHQMKCSTDEVKVQTQVSFRNECHAGWGPPIAWGFTGVLEMPFVLGFFYENQLFNNRKRIKTIPSKAMSSVRCRSCRKGVLAIGGSVCRLMVSWCVYCNPAILNVCILILIALLILLLNEMRMVDGRKANIQRHIEKPTEVKGNRVKYISACGECLGSQRR
jgi:hypothetical protein